jgi:hypothetical protein
MANDGRDSIIARAVLTHKDFNTASGDAVASARCLLKNSLLESDSLIKYLQQSFDYIQFKRSLYEYYTQWYLSPQKFCIKQPKGKI